MSTKTPRKPQRIIANGSVALSWQQEDYLALTLGLSRTDATPVLRRLVEFLSTLQTNMREAPLAPLRAHILASHKPVLEQAQKLSLMLQELTEAERKMMPCADRFAPELIEFRNHLAIGILQMEGAGSEGGGGKRRAIKRTREFAEHGVGVFWDLNAIRSDGRLQTAGLTGQPNLPDRKAFVDYCMGLIGYT